LLVYVAHGTGSQILIDCTQVSLPNWAAAAMLVELPAVQIGVCVRYKVWRSNKDKRLHLLCAEGAEAFEALPAAVLEAQRAPLIGYGFPFV
jgi:hypothetical protein